jgi:hypothetical protein
MHALLENKDVDVLTNLRRAEKLDEMDLKIIKSAQALLFKEEDIAKQKQALLFGDDNRIFQALHITKHDILKTLLNFSKHYAHSDAEMGVVKWNQNEELDLVRQFRVLVDIQYKIVEKEINFEEVLDSDVKRINYVVANIGRLADKERREFADKIKAFKRHTEPGGSAALALRFLDVIKLDAKKIVESKKILGYDADVLKANEHANKYLEGIKDNIKEQLDRINIIKALIETAMSRHNVSCSNIFLEILRHVQALTELVKHEMEYNKKFSHILDIEKKFNIKIEHHITNEMRLFFNRKYSKGLDKVIHV